MSRIMTTGRLQPPTHHRRNIHSQPPIHTSVYIVPPQTITPIVWPGHTHRVACIFLQFQHAYQLMNGASRTAAGEDDDVVSAGIHSFLYHSPAGEERS